MAAQDVNDEFHRYVNNDIPIRLLAWDLDGSLKLVGRDAVKAYFQGVVDAVKESDIPPKEAGQKRHADIQKLVRSIVGYATLSHRWSDDEV